MTVICINDSNKPKEIPANKWIKKGNKYTVIDVQHLDTKQELGFKLGEIDLDESCFPYHYFSSHRFVTEEFYNKQEVKEELVYEVE